MFRTSLIFVFVAAAMAQSGSPGCSGGFPASERQIMAGTAGLSGGTVAFRSVLTPASASSKGLGAGGISVSANTVHRYMIDEKDHLYFGYDLVIGARDVSGAYLATFQPLSKTDWIDPREIAGMKLIVLAQYPAPQLVHDDETIALDLMVSADGKSRLTDYIRILMKKPLAAKTSAEPRDFTIDDGPILFDTTQLTFWRQGQQYQGMSGFTGRPGSTLWIAVPGRGRYILSLVPHEGFARSGTIRDNVVSFADAGLEYEMRFQSPIAGAGKTWNLYVMHDIAYQPDKSHADSVDMGSDRLDNLLAKR